MVCNEITDKNTDNKLLVVITTQCREPFVFFSNLGSDAGWQLIVACSLATGNCLPKMNTLIKLPAKVQYWPGSDPSWHCD